MRYHTLGRTGLEASAVALGTNRLAESTDRREARATFELAIDRGINMIDLADCYGHGETERLVGRWTQRCRNDVILCSKVGYRPSLSVSLDRWVDPIRRWRRSNPRRPSSGGRPRPRANFSPRTLVSGIAGSLRRLGTDRLDVFYLHSPPSEVVADEVVFETLEGEKRAGRILHYGVSFPGSATTEDVLVSLRHPGVSIVQLRVNCMSTVDLNLVAEASAPAGVAIVAREPFQKGRLLPAKTVTDPSSSSRTAAQTMLRAVLQRPGVDVLLVGTTRRTHLEENIAALEASPLTDHEMSELWAHATVI